MLYRFTEIKDNLFTIKCAILFYINVINSFFAYQWLFLLKKSIKVGQISYQIFFHSEHYYSNAEHQ
jgi:hypothetical protein